MVTPLERLRKPYIAVNPINIDSAPAVKYETFITFLRGKNNISHYNYFERCYLKCLPAPLYILASSLYPTELAPGMLDVDWIRYC